MKKQRISTTGLILLSFLAAILAGTVILSLPICTTTGKATPFVDALFTSTTSVCVTGLTTLNTSSHWNIFGQAVILILIQLGGLGVITVMSVFMIFLHKKMGLSDRLLLQDAFNLNTLSGLIRFVKKVFFGTLIIEGAGALLYMIKFVPESGVKGIWISVFTSVSAFCNAGIDIFEKTGMSKYSSDLLINSVTSALIILGGIGYIVWWDFLRVIKDFRKKGFRCFNHLTLHSKIALSTTALLLFGGAILFLIFEYSNSQTMGNRTLADKLIISFFQSVTTRTAGFSTIPQKELTLPSSFLTLFLMFIGGSPAGTAGGIKTVTIAVISASAIASVKGKNQITIFQRSIKEEAIRKASAVIFISFVTVFLSVIFLSAATNASTMDILFESVSAVATVGLSRDLTSSLTTAGKLIIIASMYLGRTGPISLVIALNKRKKTQNIITVPAEDISVG